MLQCCSDPEGRQVRGGSLGADALEMGGRYLAGRLLSIEAIIEPENVVVKGVRHTPPVSHAVADGPGGQLRSPR
jgi:hypothetical protein